MLTYDSLLAQAKIRGMPANKMRGVLREYLQILILKEIYRTEAGKKFYFTGGTYLRLAHNLKRFSEDLDFYTDSIKKKEFEGIISQIKTELKRLNLDSKTRFKHWGNIYAAQIIFPTVEEAYNVVSKYSKKEGIIIKIETNKPKWRIKKEAAVISGFGEIYPCVCVDKGALFADKIDTLAKKQRGRHIYDLIFMLSNRYPIDRCVAAALGITGDLLDVIIRRIRKFSKLELKKLAEGLRPFLFEEDEADLVARAYDIIPSLVEKYRWK